MREFGRFFEKVDLAGCWNWTGATKPTGYGQFYLDNKVVNAHQAAFLLFRGPIPEGLEIDHLCQNRRCVNPFHLEAVSHQENMRRAAPNMLRSHCAHGHPLHGDNLSVTAAGRRSCRTCARERARRWYRTHKAKAAS